MVNNKVSEPADLGATLPDTQIMAVHGGFNRRATQKALINEFDTVAEMVANSHIEVGALVKTLGYYQEGDGGGNTYRIVAAGTGTADGGRYIDLDTHQAKGMFDAGGLNNFLAFGADPTNTNYSNTALRSALAYLEDIGGGVLDVPAGEYKFFRELDGNQPPSTATFDQKGGFIAGDNVHIRAAGRDVTKFNVECPGQKEGAIEDSLFWQFLVHGDFFQLNGLTIEGDVAPNEFEFVSFWGGLITIPALLKYANRAGSVFGKKTSVTECRFVGCRGMAYGTSIIDGVTFTDNDLAYTNGVNTSGADVRCNNNDWFYCELLESAGHQNFGDIAAIEFEGNTCRECNGGSIGGNANPSDEAQTHDYNFSNNTIINRVVEATAGFSISNNAVDCTVNDNVIIGLFTNCLTITEGGIPDSSPLNLHINGGYYETTKSGTSSALSVQVSEGNVHINGAHLKTDDVFALISGLSGTAKIFINSGTTLEGQCAVGYSSGSAGSVYVAIGVVWIPTTSNITNFSSNASATISDVTKFSPTVYTTKTAALANSELVELFKKEGGTEVARANGYFIRYLSGRMGWGDPDANNQAADVYLDRKAPGVLGVDASQCLKTGLDVTSNRPSASGAGQGAQFFDTTLNKPVWSDGTNWRDAAGTIV